MENCFTFDACMAIATFHIIKGYFFHNEMRYINLRFTYLLTYLLETKTSESPDLTKVRPICEMRRVSGD